MARAEAKRLREALEAEVVEFVDLAAYEDAALGDTNGLAAALASILGEDGRGVCYVDGGNTYWLLHEARRTGLLQLLPALLRKCGASYVGVSAGGILAGRRCETVEWKGWDDPGVVPEAFFSEPMVGLGLIPATVFPHYDAGRWGAVVERRRPALPGGAGELLLVPEEGPPLVLEAP